MVRYIKHGGHGESQQGGGIAPRQLGLGEHQQRRGRQVDLLEVRARVSRREHVRARVIASVRVRAGGRGGGVVL